MAGKFTMAVNVVAGTKKFRAGMKDASTSVNRFGTTVQRTSAKVVKFAKALAIGLAAGAAAAGFAISRMVKTQFALIDAQSKFASRIGISITKLQELQFAAKMSGVETATLNMALQRMTRRLAEAAAGTGESIKAIKELGLDAQALGRMTPDQQLNVLADALRGVTNQADRVRLAFKLFDSEGVALLQMLQGGSAELAKFAAEAQRLGITMSQMDADKVIAASDAMARMQFAFSGIARDLAVTIGPMMERMANAATETSKNMSWGEAIGIAMKSVVFAFKIVQLGITGILLFTVKALNGIVAQASRLVQMLGGKGFKSDLLTALELDLQARVDTINQQAHAVFAPDAQKAAKPIAAVAPMAAPKAPAGVSAPKTVAAVQQGTAAAFSAIMRAQRSGANPMLAETKKVVAAIEENNDLLTEFFDVFNRAGVLVAGDVVALN